VDLSTLGAPTGPNTGAAGCHFLYTPYQYQNPYPAPGTLVNLVYLADGNGNMWNAGNTVVGSGGTDLTNGYCTIHGATSSYSLTKDPYILNLTLDISFQGIPKAYIYEVVTNRSQQYVSGGGNQQLSFVGYIKKGPHPPIPFHPPRAGNRPPA